MLHYALKPKNPIKAIIFFYTEILQKKLLVLKISLSLKKIRIRQGNTKLETLFIFAVAQAFNYLL